MAFELKSVVPWGRSLQEYKLMFSLGADDLDKNIIGFGDGPASFNAEMTKNGKRVTSLDPIYQFTAGELRKRIDEACLEVIEQTRANKHNFVWSIVKDVDELREKRMSAMNLFLSDFEAGLEEKRYLFHSLPDKTHFADNAFDIGLSSHFLLLYSNLGLGFHKAALGEMMRICKEVRLYPLLNLNVTIPDFFDELLIYLQKDFQTQIVKVNYEFQRGGDKMLIIRKAC